MILAGVKIQVPEMALVSLLPNAGTRAGPLAAIVRPGNSKIFKTFPLKNETYCCRFGVCCIFVIQDTGGTINQNCTYIQNPGFPSAYSETTALTYTVTKCSDCKPFTSQRLKIDQKVTLNVYILSGRKLIKNAQNGPFW